MKEADIDTLLGQNVVLTDNVGNEYSGTLEKTVIRIVGYSVDDATVMLNEIESVRAE